VTAAKTPGKSDWQLWACVFCEPGFGCRTRAHAVGIPILEDAAELGLVLRGVSPPNVPEALQQYAANRWQRNARVQARALRNGQIFHAGGTMRWGRDLAMKLVGERLLDMPWLYGSGK